MKIYSILLIVFLFFTVNCSSISSKEQRISLPNNSPTPTPSDIRPTETPAQANSNLSNDPVLKQQQSDDDSFLVKIVDDEKRNAQDIHIIVGGESKWVIKTPSFEDINNFAVDEAVKNDDGFEIEVEYGTRYKYDKTFYFVEKDRTFYLTQVRIKSFDGNAPEKWSEKTLKIKPPVAIEKFEMKKYLTD